eukprot:TRINITY_DN3549_c0_g1_i2.p1 TRINITY_DN3549_c0_g1~~TRINITY_DN3549_c0_g1_i2.p1  ORF type:complete len:304 (-),score=59.63 TRINITY_DN3549_c0_g1_i2:9-920(-)
MSDSKAMQAMAHSLAGSIGGIISLTSTYPLFLASTRMQNNKEAQLSLLDSFKEIVREDGYPGLFKGLSTAIFGVSTTQGIYYYWYEFFKALYPEGKQLSTIDNTISASAAGALTAIMTNPIWVVNTRQQLARSQSQRIGGFAMAAQILRTEGVPGLFKGVLPALILVSNPTIQYVAFERLKLLWERRAGRGNLSALQIFILGAIAKIIATVITYPYILMKSRLQGADKSAYTGMSDCFHKILRDEGVLGLYKGLGIKTVQSVLAASILFMTKEKLVQYTTMIIFVLQFIIKRRLKKLVKKATA